MKLSTKVAALLSGLFLCGAFAQAQDQPNPPAGHAVNITHLRVDILLTEYAGEKKVNSLPYTLYVGASDPAHGLHEDAAYLRMGVRVPIATGSGPSTSYEYQNVGTNIDVRAFKDDGTYRLECKIERTAVSSPNEGAESSDQRNISTLPILSNFNSQFEISLRDGESGEGLSAADPFSGRVMKAEVTIHALK